MDDATFDPAHMTFEVLKWSKAASVTTLHMAFLPILLDRGVSSDHILKVVQQALQNERKELIQIIKDSVTLRKWINQHYAMLEERNRDSGITWQAGLPSLLQEKLIFLLESGFDASNLTFLAELVERLFKRYFTKAVQSLKVPLGRSTHILGVADPTGTLNPGEVHLAFSKNFPDEQSGECYPFLSNKDVLIARHPALRPSDIQRVSAVYKMELSHLMDVVVFPTRGCFPLASKLQGGDYDGDTFWICWEPDLVHQFKNAPAPSKLPPPEEFGIEVDRRKLEDVITGSSSIDGLLEESFRFRCKPELLGTVTNFHEKLTYAENGINTLGSGKLADLHDHLVDSTKNGYDYGDKAYHDYIQNCSDISIKDPPVPAYKASIKEGFEIKASSKAPAGRFTSVRVEKPKRYNPRHIVDRLYFEIIVPHIEHTLSLIGDDLRRSAGSWDAALQNPYLFEKKNGDADVVAELQRVLQAQERLYSLWCRLLKNKGDIVDDPEVYNACVEECYELYKDTKPHNLTHPVIVRWDMEPYGGAVTQWSLIKASALYTKFHEKHAFTFALAGRELSYLKATSVSKSRIIVHQMWANMKPRKLKRAITEDRAEPADISEEDLEGDEAINSPDDSHSTVEGWEPSDRG